MEEEVELVLMEVVEVHSNYFDLGLVLAVEVGAAAVAGDIRDAILTCYDLHLTFRCYEPARSQSPCSAA